MPETALEQAVLALTDEQRTAVEHAGGFSLLARPGSGKTRTVALRLAAACLGAGQRTAVASYTNTAVGEIRGVCGEVGVVVGPAHYVGTIHGLLIDYVLRPFGHLVCANTKPLRVRDEAWGTSRDASRGWRDVVLDEDGKIRVPVSKFHFDREGAAICHSVGDYVYTDAATATAKGGEQAAQLKRLHAAQGVVSQSDAVFWALRVLQKHPTIARAVAGRFHEIIVDEAQDTSDVQLACLEVLAATGTLRSLVLVADVEQSIYGFQGADPARMLAFQARRELEPLELSRNFRSSQRICDVAHRFTERDRPDIAAGPDADVNIPPELLRYPDGNPATAVESFRERLSEYELTEHDAVVLTRRRKTCELIDGRTDADAHRVVRVLGALAAARHSSRTLRHREIAAAEDVVVWLINDGLDRRGLPVESQRRLRRAVVRLAAALPEPEGELSDWIPLARQSLTSVLEDFVKPGHTYSHKPGDVLKRLAKYSGHSAATVFSEPTQSLRAQTVHAVKGQSTDAVLLVVEPASTKSNQAALLTALDAGGVVAPEDREELRIGFVSLTRARKYCAVALPDSVGEDVFARYISMGFVAA